MRYLLAAFAATVLLSSMAATPASANDSNSAIGAGGLEQVKSSAIRMVSEDLRISLEKIEVRYRFRNLSDEEQQVTVAFPLDFERNFNGGDELWNVEGDAAIDKVLQRLKFTITVDGKAVSPQSQVMRMVDRKGKDVTDRLQGFGFPLELISSRLGRSAHDRELVQKLPPSEVEALVRDGLLERVKGRLEPQWHTRLFFVLNQTYAPRQEVTVEHSYHPYKGTFFLYRDERRATLGRYCASPAIRKEVRRRNYTFQGLVVNYILTTANSWAGPIEDFRLTVDKGDSWRVFTQCGARLKRTGPTTFEMRARNFVPQRDLDILILGR